MKDWQRKTIVVISVIVAPNWCSYVVVMRSQKRSDPFAVFIQIGIKTGRSRSTASRISQRIRIINECQAGVRAGSKLGSDQRRDTKSKGRRQRISRVKAVQDLTQKDSQDKRSEMSDGAKQDLWLM